MLKAKAALAAVAIVGLSAGLASATDIAAKKIQIKAGDPVKQKVSVQSKDAAITLPAGANAPTTGGASLHVYGNGGLDECFGLPSASWEDKGTQFKYKDANKNSGQIKAAKLQVKIKNGAYGINTSSAKNPVQAIFRSGASYVLCMNCTIGDLKKDEDGKFLVKDCTAAPCVGEPGSCPPASPSGAFLD